MKVSIVIPTYKRVDYLDRLLKSIEVQTFKEFEVIVVDDSGIDGVVDDPEFELPVKIF